MHAYQLKINVNNLRKEIEKDYFKYRDIFFRCLIGNLCVYNQLYGNVVYNSIIEDSHYNQYLLYLVNRSASLEDILKEIDSPYNVSIFLDTNVYFEEFIRMKHNPKKLNNYQLTIDDMCNIVVTNMQLNRHVT